MKVYLSSTLKDLEDERKAVKEVLGGECIVKESYQAHESDLRESCLQDVGECELYIGILGLRYGFVPPGQAPGEAKSITHLEYEKAKELRLPRLVFLKDKGAIAYTDTDAGDLAPKPMGPIEKFRDQVSSGGPGEPRPAVFETVAELKLAAQKAVSDFRARKAGSTSLMAGQFLHPWEIKYEVSIPCVPGTDDTLKDILLACAKQDPRVQVFPLSPASEQDYLPRLDEQARKSRAVMPLVSPRSLSRLNERSLSVTSALKLIRQRCSAAFTLLVDVKRADLPAPLGTLFDDVFETTADDWNQASRDGTFGRLRRWLRERLPESSDRPLIGVPYMTLALTRAEAEAMRDQPDTLFARFGPSAPVRRPAYDGLCQRLAATGLNWPAGFYGERREAWRPFGPTAPTLDEFVRDAAKRVNQAPEGSRERRALRNARLVLQRYAFEEYLTDAFGSRDNLRAVCDTGCLVVVDEFALLHPDLRSPIDKLLASNNVAVVSLSACDPAHSSLRSLLDDLSYLHVGNLFSRFTEAQDIRCELAINSVERLQRWLRLVLPELMTTLGQQQSDPNLVRNVDALFAP
ncbi:MAG: Sulphatase-modifying factor protein [Proteobacteria bacterium]|nr:Sulphatase-modifying factor protein [Pseudomonadota bacterium]